MYIVIQDPPSVHVRFAINSDEKNVDGAMDLKPEDMLFGKAAKDLVSGVYDDDGNLLEAVEVEKGSGHADQTAQG